MAHQSSTIPGIVHSESPIGQETFWWAGQLLVAEDVADSPKLPQELRDRDYESAGGIRRYRLPEQEVDELAASLQNVPELQGRVSVNHLFAAQHRPPWYDHPHETYHFANLETPKPALAPPPPHRPLESAQYPVVIGVLDTAIMNHWIQSQSESVGDPPQQLAQLPNDASGHGDLIAGTILNQAPQSHLVVGPVMNTGGLVEEFLVIRALARPEVRRCQVVVLAFAGYTMDDKPPPALSLSLSQNNDSQIVVAAAGNGGHSRVRWPAAISTVLSVGALDTAARARWLYSDYGSWVDIWAPGVDIVSTYLERNSAVWSGTSASAAIVCGVIARLIGQGYTPQSAAALVRQGTEY
jgi:Subtilase family